MATRREALTLLTFGIGTAVNALRANPVAALEACAPNKPVNPGTTDTQNSCVMEGYLEVGAYISEGSPLKELSQIKTWIPGRGFKVTFSSKIKAGESYDPKQELTQADIARVVDFTHSGIAVARLITTEAGRGFAQRAYDAEGKPFADDTLEARGFSYVTNPETRHPAILVHMPKSAVELMGPGFDRELKAQGIIKKVAYMLEVVNKDGLVRVGNNGRTQRFYETMGVCDPKFGINTDQDINWTEENDYKVNDLTNIPAELPRADALIKRHK